MVASNSGTLEVTIHNLGSAPVSDALLQIGQGVFASESQLHPIPSIEAPLDLTPRSVTLTLPYKPGPSAGPITVRILPAPGTDQITASNDAVIVSTLVGPHGTP